MGNIHDEIKNEILKYGFKSDFNDEYDYIFTDGTWFYKLNFEGYAYVLYKRINIYVRPLMSLFKIYNKFNKGTAQIGLHYDVPIAEIQEADKIKKLMDMIIVRKENPMSF